MKLFFKFISGSLLFFLLFLVAFLCSCTKPEAAGSNEEIEHHGDAIFIPETSPLRKQLGLDVVNVQKIQSHFSAPAVVEADPVHFTKIFPPLNGHIIKINVRLGESVEKGQPLLTMESPDFTTAQSDYTKAKSAYFLADRALQREKDLLANGIAAKRDVESAENDYEQAKSEMDRTSTRLKALQLDPDKQQFGEPMQILSPLSGQVLDFAAGLGEYRNDPTAPIMTIGDLSTIWLTVNVQEKDISRVSVGQEVTASFISYPDEVFKGKVLFIGGVLDPDSRAFKVRIEFQNSDGRLRPGMFATVTFVGKTEDAIVVPSAAIIQQGDSLTVFVENQPWTFEQRKVVTGPQEGNITVIKSGLDAGTKVIVRNGILLQ